MIPQTLKMLFWDVPFEAIDPKANKNYVISRILELGDESAVNWLEHEYTKDELRETVQVSRSLSGKSRNYWKIKYNIA